MLCDRGHVMVWQDWDGVTGEFTCDCDLLIGSDHIVDQDQLEFNREVE